MRSKSSSGSSSLQGGGGLTLGQVESPKFCFLKGEKTLRSFSPRRFPGARAQLLGHRGAEDQRPWGSGRRVRSGAQKARQSEQRAPSEPQASASRPTSPLHSQQNLIYFQLIEGLLHESYKAQTGAVTRQPVPPETER